MDEDKCCELLDSKQFDKKTVEWKGRPFIKKHYLAFFYMPLGLDSTLKGLLEDLNSKGLISEEHPVMIWRNEGMFGGDVYVALKEEDSSYEVERLSGKFFTMFFEGKDYKEAGKWHKVLWVEAKKRKLDVKEVISYYGQCPGCMKKFGKLQTVLYARIS
jgi:hypothetical protein